jgi:hypothetical protein
MITGVARILRVQSSCLLTLLAGMTATTQFSNALQHHQVCHNRCVLPQQQQQQPHHSRRRFSEVFFAGAIVSPFALAHDAAAAAIDTGAAGEAIRRGASNIPGYGPSDVLYPASFVGRWAVTRQTKTEESSEKTISYDMRFVPTKSSDGATAAAIQDRGYNLVQQTTAVDPNQSNPVQSYTWTENNPNDLLLVLNDGTRIDIKVTKRSMDTTRTTEDDSSAVVVTSSEVARITTDRGRIPIIEARRTLQKWKVVSDNVVEGLEIVYDVGGGNLGDPMAMTIVPSSSATKAGPRLISKSRLHLERIL